MSFPFSGLTAIEKAVSCAEMQPGRIVVIDGEESFVIAGPDDAHWQVIEKQGSENEPVTEFHLVTTNN